MVALLRRKRSWLAGRPRGARYISEIFCRGQPIDVVVPATEPGPSRDGGCLKWLRGDGGGYWARSVSRNRTGSPVDGASTSPCHITRRPRTKVPTGQPLTLTPSYGVQPAREAIH